GLAEALRDLLQKTRPNNPVRVTTPGQAPAQPPRDKNGGEEEEDAPPTGKPASKPQIVDPQSDKAKTGTKNAPITISVVGNRWIVEADDPQALEMATELARLLRRSSTSGSFEVIALQHASAADAAKVLDEAFNNAKPQNQQQQNPFFRGFNPFMFQQQQQQE